MPHPEPGQPLSVLPLNYARPSNRYANKPESGKTARPQTGIQTSRRATRVTRKKVSTGKPKVARERGQKMGILMSNQYS